MDAAQTACVALWLLSEHEQGSWRPRPAGRLHRQRGSSRLSPWKTLGLEVGGDPGLEDLKSEVNDVWSRGGDVREVPGEDQPSEECDRKARFASEFGSASLCRASVAGRPD